jgi:hypothetical protein
MKHLKFLLLAVASLLALQSCNPNYGNGNYGQGGVVVNQPTAVVTPASNLGDNLNLQALGEMVKTSQNAQDIENKLNQPNSINNLDLDGDGKVDYIKVTEYGTGGQRGFSFTVDLAGGQSQEVATVELQQGQNQQASMNIQGNQNLYGNNGYYSSNYLMTDLLIWHYLFYPHAYYMSPYRYGFYPSYYHPYGMCSRGIYGGRMGTYTRNSTIRTTTTRTVSSSPNRNMSSSSVSSRAKSMSAPQRSQKAFSTTSNSRPSTGGFGNRSSSSSPSRSSSFGSSSSRSSGSSSRSSFGSSSRSSGSSSHSSGGSRRSDLEFKKDIKPLDNQLAKVCSLKGKNYYWNMAEFPYENFDSRKQIGFIAQDLEKVYPEVVSKRPDGKRTVDYDLLVPALVEAIKELNAKVVKQDSVITFLSQNTVQFNPNVKIPAKRN